MTTKKPWEGIPQNNTASLIDELQSVRAEIARLDEREGELSKQVREFGDGEHKGIKFKAIVKTTRPERLDIKAMKEVLDDRLIKKYTKLGKPTITITFQPISLGKDT